MLKKILALVLSSVILLSSTATVFAATIRRPVIIDTEKIQTELNSVKETSPADEAEADDNNDNDSNNGYNYLLEVMKTANELGIMKTNDEVPKRDTIDSENNTKEILTVQELEHAIEAIRPSNYVEYVNFESNEVTLGSLLQRIWISAGAPTYINTQMSNANQYGVDTGLIEKEKLHDINAPIDRYSAAEILLRYYYSIDMTVTSNSASQTDESGDTLNSVDIIDDAIVKLLFTIGKNDIEVLLPTNKFTENQMEDINECIENQCLSCGIHLPLPGNGEVIQGIPNPIHIVCNTLYARFGNSDTESSSSEKSAVKRTSGTRMVYNLEFCIDYDNGIV